MLWILIIIALIMGLTCPDEADHQLAVQEKIKEMREANEDPVNLMSFAAVLSGGPAEEFVEISDFKYRVLFSTAKVNDVNTFGILGHVFVLGGEKEEKYERWSRKLGAKSKYKYVNADKGSCSIWCSGRGLIEGCKANVELYVRYRDSDKWHIYVVFEGKLFAKPPVSAVCRCGVNDWHHDAWGASKEATATFYNGDAVDLVNEMRHHSHFEMSVKAANGSSCSASFEGVGEKVQELINYYNANKN